MGVRLARAVRRAAGLGPRDWIDLLAAWALLQRAAWKLRSGAFPPELVVLLRGGEEPPGTPDAAEAARVERLVDLFRLASRVTLLRCECLARSLALRRLLGRHGIAASLRIGVRKEPSGVEGHAWLEWRGATLYDAPEAVARYQPLHVGSAGDLPERITVRLDGVEV